MLAASAASWSAEREVMTTATPTAAAAAAALTSSSRYDDARVTMARAGQPFKGGMRDEQERHSEGHERKASDPTASWAAALAEAAERTASAPAPV
mmetsp:Transcript_6577/g.23440  ORF Transcript_6577/g.23440 Transcript_6577/m.23440 type:complete len:95 (+) Transcript_6577:263-547(+)